MVKQKKVKKSKQSPKTHICILLPNSYSYFDKAFGMSLMSMISEYYLEKERPGSKLKGTHLSLLSDTGVSIDNMRNKLAGHAINVKADIVLWLDNDMVFPSNMIQIMYEDLLDNPDVEAITGVYTWKAPPYVPHVYLKKTADGKRYAVASKFPINALFPVEGCGFGCVMMKTSVFQRVPEPYFEFIIGKDGKRMGEDLGFCMKSDMKMLCDSRLLCGHLYQRAYGLQDYVEYNGLEKTKDGWNITKEQVNKISEEYMKQR